MDLRMSWQARTGSSCSQKPKGTRSQPESTSKWGTPSHTGTRCTSSGAAKTPSSITRK
jgi:hypothetical protein